MFDAKAYNTEFVRNVYDSIMIRLPKGAKEILKDHCESKNKSVNQYISELILWDLGYKDWKQAMKAKKSQS